MQQQKNQNTSTRVFRAFPGVRVIPDMALIFWVRPTILVTGIKPNILCAEEHRPLHSQTLDIIL